MDSATEANFHPSRTELGEKLKLLSMESQINELQRLVMLQSRAIDNLMARLIVIDKSFVPQTGLHMQAINEARETVAILEQQGRTFT